MDEISDSEQDPGSNQHVAAKSLGVDQRAWLRKQRQELLRSLQGTARQIAEDFVSLGHIDTLTCVMYQTIHLPSTVPLSRARLLLDHIEGRTQAVFADFLRSLATHNPELFQADSQSGSVLSFPEALERWAPSLEK